MQQQMAMPCPAAERIRADQKADPLSRLNNDCVFTYLETAAIRLQFTPQTMQVHGVSHHGVVVQNNASSLAVFKVHGRGLAEFKAVD